MMTFDFVAHLKRQITFSKKTFGPGARTKGVSDHIRKELEEIGEDPLALDEWVDVILLACDGAWRAGYSAESIACALDAKLTKNEGRVWPDWCTADPDKAIEHDRSGEVAR
ncbi:dATP/dGTP pyrophosphohydrolase domain-containing protein [Methylopila sp. M107]|uniref:dATP/dGTP pyrophosphohydrolase domain-containing protein n=1 Tax=Methylopila sp. M107 TaxID=1101190 RepID=UPI0003695CDC|nr:dATP/dGTP pyrophosphohydrolase domain-containing protein [Methylopila sp. M107]